MLEPVSIEAAVVSPTGIKQIQLDTVDLRKHLMELETAQEVYRNFKYFKHWADKYPTLNSIIRTTFGVSFILLRLIMWPILSAPFCEGSLTMLYNGTAHSPFVVAYFLAANLFLTGLQFSWGRKIISSIIMETRM